MNYLNKSKKCLYCKTFGHNTEEHTCLVCYKQGHSELETHCSYCKSIDHNDPNHKCQKCHKKGHDIKYFCCYLENGYKCVSYCGIDNSRSHQRFCYKHGKQYAITICDNIEVQYCSSCGSLDHSYERKRYFYDIYCAKKTNACKYCIKNHTSEEHQCLLCNELGHCIEFNDKHAQEMGNFNAPIPYCKNFPLVQCTWCDSIEHFVYEHPCNIDKCTHVGHHFQHYPGFQADRPILLQHFLDYTPIALVIIDTIILQYIDS